MEYFIRITPQGAVSTVSTDNPHLYWYYGQINADNIEIVRGFADRSKQVMVVDEEGAINGSDVNPVASFLARQIICGTALIAREDLRNGEPDIVGFTIEQVTAARMALHVFLMESELFEDTEKEGD